jgi:hypothetical protein
LQAFCILLGFEKLKSFKVSKTTANEMFYRHHLFLCFDNMQVKEKKLSQISYNIPFPIADVEITTQEHANVFNCLKYLLKKPTKK